MKYTMMFVASIILLVYSVLTIPQGEVLSFESFSSPIALSIGVTLLIIFFLKTVFKEDKWEYTLSFIFVIFGIGGMMIFRFGPLYLGVASSAFCITLMIAVIVKLVYSHEKHKAQVKHSA